MFKVDLDSDDEGTEGIEQGDFLRKYKNDRDFREFMRRVAPGLASAIDKNEQLPSKIGIDMAKKKEFRAMLEAASAEQDNSSQTKGSMPGRGVTIGGSTPDRSQRTPGAQQNAEGEE